MAKIPFDIKYRPQIESGEYTVETRDESPARVVCWDANSYTPIVFLVTEHDDLDNKDKEYTYSCNNFGRAFSIESPKDLFIVTTEPELTEFEQCLADIIMCYEGYEDHYAYLKEKAAELLDLARKEIIDGWSKGLRDTQDCSGKAYNDGYNLGFKIGYERCKTEAFKGIANVEED